MLSVGLPWYMTVKQLTFEAPFIVEAKITYKRLCYQTPYGFIGS